MQHRQTFATMGSKKTASNKRRHESVDNTEDTGPSRRVTRAAAVKVEPAAKKPAPAKKKTTAGAAAPAPAAAKKAAAKKPPPRRRPSPPPSEQDDEIEDASQEEQRQLPKFPIQESTPLNQAALQALRGQDAQSHDHTLRLLAFDDRLAELASQRGLLVKFVVKRVGTNAAIPIAVVDAPEFMTVEYLKRRIMKARLINEGRYLNPGMFMLRATQIDPATNTSRLVELTSRGPGGEEVFLSDLGFEAPGSYEVLIASAPVANDREQQNRMLAAAGGSNLMSAGPVSPDRQAYRSLLTAAAGGDGGANGTVPRPAAPRIPTKKIHPEQARRQSDAQFISPARQQAGVGTGGGVPPSGDKVRRPKCPWQPDEVESLIEGIQAFGTSWAEIHGKYTRGDPPRIDPRRTQVDLKDKWRNLVKLVTEPGLKPRGMDITDDLKTTILRLMMSSGMPVGAAGEDQQQQQQQQRQQPHSGAPDDVSRHGEGQ